MMFLALSQFDDSHHRDDKPREFCRVAVIERRAEAPSDHAAAAGHR